LTFGELADKAEGSSAFQLTATATSSLPVSFETTTPSVVSIANGQVTLLKAGRASVTAKQEGNSGYNAAQSVTRSFCVNPAKPVVASSFANPEIPVLTSSASAGNQWYRNNELISGATSSAYPVSAPGTYVVKVTADDCAVATSDAAVIVITGIEAGAGIEVKAYPNPASENILLTLPGSGVKKISIRGVDGREVHHAEVTGEQTVINVSHFPAGVYVIGARSATYNSSIRFIKNNQ
jgi:hypothetical protein